MKILHAYVLVKGSHSGGVKQEPLNKRPLIIHHAGRNGIMFHKTVSNTDKSHVTALTTFGHLNFTSHQGCT